MNGVALDDYYRTGLLFLVPFVPVLGYGAMYLALRLCGKLRVNAAGWNAGGVHVGRRIVLQAVWLLATFQPVLSVESSLMRRFSRRGGAPEQAVSEVVVELVPFA